MKVYITTDEAYPVYEVSSDKGYWGDEAEVTEEEWAFIQKAHEDYQTAQSILERAYKNAQAR